MKKVNYHGVMDTECVALCHAINKLPGIRTRESCCGHGEEEFRIYFEATTVEALDQLWSLVSQVRWTVQVGGREGGRSDGRIFFVCESRSIGQAAYDEADLIADDIESQRF